MEIISYSLAKSSNGCYVWVFDEEGEVSNFYIHKWRVPDPVPKVIDVVIRFGNELIKPEAYDENFNPVALSNRPELKRQPIRKSVFYTESHNDTTRYDTRGSETPFHTIYLPNQVFKGCSSYEKILQIEVRWF